MGLDPRLQDEYEMEGIFLAAPFAGRQRIRQGWGENPAHYMGIRIAGTPLLGHNGLDFELSAGTEILAADDGQVIELDFDPAGYGRYLRILHRWGESLYAHLQDSMVESGERVRRGQIIGHAGRSARSTHDHLHFAIRIDPYQPWDGWGGYTNPLPFLDPQNLLMDGTS